jgi:hypothetical protein
MEKLKSWIFVVKSEETQTVSCSYKKQDLITSVVHLSEFQLLEFAAAHAAIKAKKH